MQRLPDHVWRNIEAKTIEDYLAPQLDFDDPPSVAKILQTEGYDPSEVSHHALIKTERYATVGAAIILQTDSLVDGSGTEAQFAQPLINARTINTELPPLDSLGRDIAYTYRTKTRELCASSTHKTSRLSFLFSEYKRLSEDDVAPSKNDHIGFIRNGGGLADGLETFLYKLQPGVERYLNGHDADKLTIYHDLAVLGISRATHHLAVHPGGSNEWDTINTDEVEIVRRGAIYTARTKQGPLLRTPQYPNPHSLDPIEADPIELERPRLKCPAHAHLQSSTESALTSAFHASINIAAAREII